MADDEEAVMFACRSFVFCAPDLHQSLEHLLEKSEVGMSTPVHVVATSLNTYRASRACRDERVAPTSATLLVTSRHDFYLCKNAWAR